MRTLEGGVTAPKGFRAAGVAVGIKAEGGKKDCALVVSHRLASLAGAFTTNLMKAAPVKWTEAVCRWGKARAVFINSGNANSCTGPQGERDVVETAQRVAQAIQARAEEICVCSTGVIGVSLPMGRVLAGVDACAKGLSNRGSRDAAEAIMTTDTRPKERAIETSFGASLGGIAKGAGMIAPSLAPPPATMIAVITTDAVVEPGPLAEALSRAVTVSFNRICVDNDTSTNDTVLCLANGQAGGPTLAPGMAEYVEFEESLTQLCQGLAKDMVEDGEGATKFVEIVVEGAGSVADAEKVARAVGQSQLCKTAFFGQDPNWGRIACAVGYAGVPFEPVALAIWLEDIQLVSKGAPTAYDEKEAAARMELAQFQIRIRIGEGAGSAVFWTTDLSHDYVTLNAHYRS